MASLITKRNRIEHSRPHLEVASGNIASFSTDRRYPLKGLKVHFYCQQSGSGTPSPTNIRPLSGWSGLDIWRAGRNLFDKDSMVDRSQTCYIDESGNIVSNRNWYITDWIPVEGTTVTISGVGGNAPSIALYDENKNFLVGHRYGTSTADIKTSITLTASQDAYYCRFSVYYRDDYADSIKLELGSSATDYEPFVGTKNSIVFSETIYGGNAEVISGKGESIFRRFDLGTRTWVADDQTGAPGCFRCGGSDFGGNLKYMGQVYCDQYLGVQKSSWTNVDYGEISITNSQANPIVRIRDTRFVDKTAAEVKAMLSGVIACFEETTPTEFVFDPITLKTLRGQNNIWSNANGITECTFWTH